MINMRPFFCNLRELLGIYKELKLNEKKSATSQYLSIMDFRF